MATEHEVQLQILRTQLEASQSRYMAELRARTRSEAALARYLSSLFPGTYSQALAARKSVTDIGEEFYPLLLARRIAAPPPAAATPAAPPENALPPSPPEPAPASTVAELSSSALELLWILGRHILVPSVEEQWQRTQLALSTLHNRALPELLRAQFVQVVTIKGALRVLRGYASDVNYVLTPAGRAAFQAHFKHAPVRFEEAYAGYPSAACWWLHRAVKALILAGNAHPDNRRFDYTVYDPVTDAAAYQAAGLQTRYGQADSFAEPDLVVFISSRTGGEPVRIAVECENANYSAPTLKSKVSKTVKWYLEAGFQAVYYIMPNSAAVGLVHQALSKCQADLRAAECAPPPSRQWWPDRAFFASFNLLALKDAWLPTAKFIEDRFFNRETGAPAEDWPTGAARPERYYRYRWPKELRGGKPA